MIDIDSEQSAAEGLPLWRRGVTLCFCVLLHAFTHGYEGIIIPLYNLVKTDLNLETSRQATALVAVYGLVYCLGSYFAGMLADRYDRGRIIAVGLALNALAFVLISGCRDYGSVLVLIIAGGLAGSLFHPAANALAMSLFPRRVGTAVGIMGVGTGLGFFFGQLYSGWRAESAGWSFWFLGSSGTGWRAPCRDAGYAGLVVAVLTLIVVRDIPGRKLARSALDGGGQTAKPVVPWRRLFFVGCLVAFAFALRDLGGRGAHSMLSLYLQNALRKSPEKTGAILAVMTLAAIVANPIMGHFSQGGRRLPFLGGALFLAGLGMLSIPYWPPGLILVPLLFYNFFILGTYAVGETALMERASPEHRGKLIGTLLLIAGTISAFAHVAAGWYVDRLGADSSRPESYRAGFLVLGLLVMCAVVAVPLIRQLEKRGPEASKGSS